MDGAVEHVDKIYNKYQEQQQDKGTALLERDLCGRASTMKRLKDYKIGELIWRKRMRRRN